MGCKEELTLRTVEQWNRLLRVFLWAPSFQDHAGYSPEYPGLISQLTLIRGQTPGPLEPELSYNPEPGVS